MIDNPSPDVRGGRVNYEALGRSVEEALIKDYIYVLHSTRRQIWSSFIRGIFAGLGSVIGATLVVGVLLGLLQLFGGAPLVGHYFKDIGDSIHSR